jgi:hypothetical protein
MPRFAPAALSLLLLAAPALLPAPASAAGYDQYCNPRYGFCVDHPRDFTPGPEPENGDGLDFTGPDGFVMTASGSNNVEDHRVADEMNEWLGRFDRVTYRRSGGNWFALSGLKGDNIIYLKGFVGKGSIDTLLLRYPASGNDAWAATVGHISNSFKPGDLSALH